MLCTFCHFPKDSIILDNDLAFAFFDKYPVQKGHVLIVPKRHIESYFSASSDEIQAIQQLLLEGKRLLDDQYTPDGYNIGVNVGECGGQTIMHLHVHLIPRYKGDVQDPRGGIRKLMPNLVQYP